MICHSNGQTGSDAYANARNKAALKDSSYKSVAVATAEMKILAGFMHAGEVVEASKVRQRTFDATPVLAVGLCVIDAILCARHSGWKISTGQETRKMSGS